MINSRDINDLSTEARIVCLNHVADCLQAGIKLTITSTYRDADAQTDLYAVGRTKYLERRTVTNAKAWQSWHNFRCAWDVVPIIGGKAVWEDPVLWKDIIRIGEAVGAEAGAKWESFPDKPHFQVRPFVHGLHINLDEARQRFQSFGTIFKG